MEYSDIYREVQIVSSGTAGFEDALGIASRIWCEATGNDCIRDIVEDDSRNLTTGNDNRKFTTRNRNFAGLYHNIPEYDTTLHQAIEATKDREAFVVLVWQPIGTYTEASKGGSFDLLCQAMAAKPAEFAAKQKERLALAIIELLDWEIEASLLAESFSEQKDLLVAAINEKYPDAPDKLQAFLDALASKMGGAYPLEKIDKGTAEQKHEIPTWATDPDIAKNRLVPVSCALVCEGLPPHKGYLNAHFNRFPKQDWYAGRIATLSQYSKQGCSKLVWDAVTREIFEIRGGQQLILSRRIGENDGNGKINPDGYLDSLAAWYRRKFGNPTVVPVPETPEQKIIGLLEAVYTYPSEAYFGKAQDDLTAAWAAAAHNIRSMAVR
jgi:hypothetical protein